MTTKFNADDTAFVPVWVRSISINGDRTIRYNVDVIGPARQINFTVKEEDLIKTPDDLENYIIILKLKKSKINLGG